MIKKKEWIPLVQMSMYIHKELLIQNGFQNIDDGYLRLVEFSVIFTIYLYIFNNVWQF